METSPFALKDDSRSVEVSTREGALRFPQTLLFTMWQDAEKCCSTVNGRLVISCFHSFPSLPVEASLAARLQGENTLFWMLLRRLDAAHQSLHGSECPPPATDPSGYNARLREYGVLVVSTLFLLAACHQLMLSWNADIIVEKLTSQLSLRTLPLIFDAATRFRHGDSEGRYQLLCSCHDMWVKEGWRYDDATRQQVEVSDCAYVERATALASVAHHHSSAAADTRTLAGASAATEDVADADESRVLEARLRSVEREIEAQRVRNEAAFAAALERRLAEIEDALAQAQNKASALEAGLCASRELALSTAPDKAAEDQGAAVAESASEHPIFPDAGPKVYAAAMVAAREELMHYLSHIRTKLETPKPLDALVREADAVFELAAEREAGNCDRHARRLRSLAAQSLERAREIATVRQRLAEAVESADEARRARFH